MKLVFNNEEVMTSSSTVIKQILSALGNYVNIEKLNPVTEESVDTYTKNLNKVETVGLIVLPESQANEVKVVLVPIVSSSVQTSMIILDLSALSADPTISFLIDGESVNWLDTPLLSAGKVHLIAFQNLGDYGTFANLAYSFTK